MTDAYMELRERADREAEKAREKYGPTHDLPGGNPTKDVLDYAINEVVGLLRYGTMIRSRELNRDPDSAFASKAVDFRMNMKHWALELIRHRSRLLERGVTLGQPEGG